MGEIKKKYTLLSVDTIELPSEMDLIFSSDGKHLIEFISNKVFEH